MSATPTANPPVTPGQAPSTNPRNSRPNISRNSAPTFKGATPELNGNVFQTKAEQRKKNQYQSTIDALKIYSSVTHKKEAKLLTPLWRDLKQPKVPLPKEPKEESKEETYETEEGGQTITKKRNIVIPVTKVEQAIFDEKNQKLGKRRNEPRGRPPLSIQCYLGTVQSFNARKIDI